MIARQGGTEGRPAVGRTPEEIFAHHLESLEAHDLEEIVADFDDDAVLVAVSGSARGKDAVRAAYEQLLSDLPQAEWDVPTQVFEGDLLFIEWGAVSGENQVTDGISTFVFTEDGIRAQTVRFTLEARD
jgi:hypothetical protein